MATSSTTSDYLKDGQQINVNDFDEFNQISENGSDQEETSNFYFNEYEIHDDDETVWVPENGI